MTVKNKRRIAWLLLMMIMGGIILLAMPNERGEDPIWWRLYLTPPLLFIIGLCFIILLLRAPKMDESSSKEMNALKEKLKELNDDKDQPVNPQ
jgi:cytochrome bd-type quinol oxidase subunit 2